MPSRLLRVALWAFVAAATVVLWAHLIPSPGTGRLDARVPFTQLAAMRPALTAGAVLLALVVLLALGVARLRGGRRGPSAADHATAAPRSAADPASPARRPAAVARRPVTGPAVALLVVGVASAAQIAPRVLASPAPARADAPGLVVLTANLLRSGVAPAVLVDLVRRSDADVLTLPETSAPAARRIARALTVAGGERWRAFGDGTTAPEDEGSARPTSLVVRAALGPRRLAVPADAPRAHGQVRVRLARVATGSGPGPRVAAVHPLPPWPAAAQRDWRRDLLALRALCRDGWVLGGDLNATIDHSPLRSVLGAGCDDAAASAGQGLRPTWTGGAFGAVRPAIDHVLASGDWRTAGAGVLRIAGSDHRAVWARVVRR